jgi:hypothetical protein
MSDRALPKFPRLIAVRGRFEACDKPLLSEGRGRDFESRRVRHLFNHLDNPTAARVPVVSRPRACALRSCAAPNPGFDTRRAAPLLSRGRGSGARQGSRGRGASGSLAARCRSGRTGRSRNALGAVPARPVPYRRVRFSAAFSPVAVASCPARSCPVLGRSVPIRVPIFDRLKRSPNLR